MDNDCTVYASTSNKVYGYDLRHHSTAVSNPSSVIKHLRPHFDLTNNFQCTDEINQLSFSYPKQTSNNNSSSSNSIGKYYISAADDSGEVHTIESLNHRYEYEWERKPQKNKPTKILTHAEPDSMGITSSAIFQPRSNNETYIATAGTDCTVKLFDINKPNKATCSIKIKLAETANTAQLCNPPYVQTLSWSASGRLLTAGCGDGSCIIFRAEGRRLVEIGRLGCDVFEGHNGSVASVCFPNFGICEHQGGELYEGIPAKVRKSGEVEDRLMVSAGNDGHIIFWDLGANMVGDNPLDPALYLDKCLSTSTAKLNAEDEKISAEDEETVKKILEGLNISPTQDLSSPTRDEEESKEEKKNVEDEDELSPSPPRVLFKIGHRYKTNWMTCNRASDAILPNSLFVADTTRNISVYTLPL